MASTTNKQHQIKFMGPAQQEFHSFAEQANYFLDTYCPDWKRAADNDCVKSYIIPPIFCYKRADSSDEAFEKAVKEQNSNDQPPLIKDRSSDEAEYIIYKAISQLVQEGVQAPFFVIHGLNIDRIKHQLPQIFPEVRWADLEDALKSCFREYDFLLIGPKIGIIAIEVKHPSYEKDFLEMKNSLPKRYQYGLTQLGSTNVLFRLLRETAGVKMPQGIPVQKILFAPNLTRERYEKWMESRKPEIIESIRKKLAT